MLMYPLFKNVPVKMCGPGVTRVVLTADNHLRLTHLGSRERGADFREALLSVIDCAVQAGADAIINAGDVMDSPQVQPAVADDLRLVDEHCRKAKLPMYTLLGNHDFAQPSWLEVQRLASGSFGDPHGIIPFDNTAVQVGPISFYGMPFMSPMLLRERLAKSVDADVLVWHGSVQEFAGFPVEGMITVADLMVQPWSAVLLGDIHITKFLDVNGCPVGYPGATELIKKDEPLEHSCTVVDFDNITKKVLRISFMPVKHRKVITLRLDTEDQLDAALVQLQAAQKLAPIVFVKYSTGLTLARARLTAAAGAKALCRLEGYDPLVMQLSDKAHDADIPKPEHYVDQVLPADRELAAAAKLLCNPEASAGDVLRDFIAQSML
jgi:DNA repair exonuclease SbcCD nuclease subunit